MRALPLLLLFTPSLAFAATGTIDIQVEGAPGEVILDGFPTGQTAPTKMQSVPTGEHTVELEYGCRKAEATVTVEPAQTAVVALDMLEVGGQGTLFLRGLADNAEVLLNGEPLSGADEGARVACGDAKLEVSVPGFEPWTQSVVITSGKRTELDVELEYESFDIEPDPLPVVEDEVEDLDFLDEPDEPDAPARPLTELDMLDAPEEPEDGRRGGRGGRGEDAPDRADEIFGDLDDPEFDEPGPAFDDPDFDEPDFDDPDFDDPDFDDRPDDEDELDEIVPREKPKPAREPLPVRGIATGAGAAVGGVGFIIGFASTPAYRSAKAQYDTIVATAGEFSAQAIEYEQNGLAPARAPMAAGYALGVVGAGAAAASYLLIPARDSSDLVFSPTPGGLMLSGSF